MASFRLIPRRQRLLAYAPVLLVPLALCPIQGSGIADGAAAGRSVHSLITAFAMERGLAAQERLQMEIEQRPEAGAPLLALAQRTGDERTEYLALRGLGNLRYEPAAPFLIRSLGDPRHYIRANAARALGDMRYAGAVAPLLAALARDEDEGVVQQTSAALGMLGAHDAVPQLRNALSKYVARRSIQTRIWILIAIGQLGSAQDVGFLAQYLDGTDEATECVAADAIAAITGGDFGLPHLSGPASLSQGLDKARRWWDAHRGDAAFSS